MIFSDVAHLQQDMSVQVLLAVWAVGLRVLIGVGLVTEALQKDVAETAIPGTPDSRYQICACPTEGTKSAFCKNSRLL